MFSTYVDFRSKAQLSMVPRHNPRVKPRIILGWGAVLDSTLGAASDLDGWVGSREGQRADKGKLGVEVDGG